MTADPTGSGGLTGTLLLNNDCEVLASNATARRWLGFGVEELKGMSLHTLLGGGGQFFLRAQILPMLQLKETLEEVYLQLRGKSGDAVPVLANIGYVAVEAGPLIELSFLRIIQRGKLEDELLLAKKLAEQANDAKTKFLGMMSHELRTPLQQIGLNNQLLCDGEFGLLLAPQEEIIRTSQDAMETVVALIDDILNFAGMQGGKLKVTTENLTLGRTLRRAETSIRHRVEQTGLSFVVECTEPDLVFRGDSNRLQQILANLLNNALKFTPRGGRISLSGGKQGEWAFLEVGDTGCGIPAEHLDRIFEPFTQLRSTVESTDKPGIGLGLSICRDLAKAMNGQISVRSEPGQGSTFRMMLPLA